MRAIGSGLLGLYFCLLLAGIVAAAEPVRIVAWNVHEGFTPEAMRARAADFQQFARAEQPDLVLVEEVVSLAVVEAVRDAMGLQGYECACSDFAPGDEPDFGFFEVGLISKYPLSQVIEYDATPDRVATKTAAPAELALNPLLKLGIERPNDDVRGFLWARIDALKLTVNVVHLKSSRGVDGGEDRANAAKREYVMAAVAAGVVEDRQLWPDYNCLVGGDFNVGHSDPKNGVDLREDHDASAVGRDGYDETHALLRGGLVGGLKMINLLAHTRESTFPSFPSTPIDNLYVVGPDAAQFAPGSLSRETYGSDHRAISTVFTTTVRAVAPAKKPQPGTSAAPPQTPEAAPVPGILTIEQARQYVGRTVTVELTVVSSTLVSDRRLAYLNSTDDFRRPENFTIVLPPEAVERFAAQGIKDPAAHFAKKRVRVTGRVALRREQGQIVLGEPSQIVIVAPSK